MKALPVIDLLEKERKPLDDILIAFVIPEMHLLVFQSFVERLHERIVIGIAFSRHADLETVLAKQRHVSGRGIFNAAVGMMNAAAGSARFSSQPQRRDTESRVDAFRVGPADDTSCI